MGVKDTFMKLFVKPVQAQAPTAAAGTLDPQTAASDLMKKTGWNIYSGLVPRALLQDPDPIVTLAGSRGLIVFEDMLIDPVIEAANESRKNAINALDWEIIAASSDPEDVARRDHIADACEKINGAWSGNSYLSGMTTLLRGIEEAGPMGFSVLQAMWNFAEARIVETQHEIPLSFDFRDEDKNWTYADYYTSTRLVYFADNNYTPTPAPPYKFMHFVRDPKYGSPRGRSWLRSAYWPYFFGFLNVLKFEVNALDKQAQPTVVADVPLEWWNDQKFIDKLLTIMSNYQTEMAAIFPRGKDGKELVRYMVDTSRSSTFNAYESFQDRMDRKKVLAITGVELSQMQAQFGTRAQGQVQEFGVRFEFTKSDADWIQSQMQIPVQWMCDLRFGRNENSKYPQFKLKYEKQEDLDKVIRRMLLTNKAVPIKVQDYYNAVGLTPPGKDDKGNPEPAVLPSQINAQIPAPTINESFGQYTPGESLSEPEDDLFLGPDFPAYKKRILQRVREATKEFRR